LNEAYTPAQITEYSLDLTATMLACGLDPNRGCFYTQSGAAEVSQLAWILACQAPIGMLQRAHSYKDAIAKGIEVNMGLFNYPILMAADILIYDATHVPVGKDQKQHLELARDFAQRFNNRYGEILILPEPIISEQLGVLPGIDGEKMSKSKGNVIPIFGTDKEWKKAVMAIKTDSKGLDDPKVPDSCLIFQFYRLLADREKQDEMAESYRRGGYGYGHAKLALLAALQDYFGTLRERYLKFKKDTDYLRDVLATGAGKAREIALKKLEEVHKATGLVL